MSQHEQLVSSLDSSLFRGLISQPRYHIIRNNEGNPNDDDAHCEDLRRQIITKLKSNAAGSQPINTIGDVLKLSPTALLHILDPCLTYVECNRLITRIHEMCAVQPVSALDVMKRTNPTATNASIGKLATGLPTLDTQLRGGFSVSSITEIVGRAAVGKTHLSQQLVSEAAASGSGGSIYIDTENKMSVVRLKEIALERGNKRRRLESPTVNERDPDEQVLENVTVHQSLTTRELLDTLDRLDTEIRQRNLEADECNRDIGGTAETQNSRRAKRLPVRLLVLDSIAAPLRRDFSSPNTAMDRASSIFEIACKLKQLADDFQLAVVVVNQVGGGNSSGESGQRNDTLDMNDGEYTGSLGTVWQHCISTRVTLEHCGDPNRLEQGQNKIRRGIITKSLISKNAEFNFELTREGVREISGGGF